MDKGTLIEFLLNGNRRLAVLERQDGKTNWIVIDDRGQSHTLHPRKVTYEVVGQTYKPADIANFLEEVKPYLEPSSLEVAWEILVEDGESVEISGMASLLFSDRSPPVCYAAYCLLSEDKLYFKRKGDRYEPRPMAQVAEIKHQLEVEEQKRKQQQEFLQRVQKRITGETVEWQESDRTRIELIEKFVLQPENVSRVVQDNLIALGRAQNPEAARELLVDLGLWSPHENLFLRRSQIPVDFPPMVTEVAKRCLDFPPPDPDVNRLDLTHLKVYTIDDESTQEIDDGLSVEYIGDLGLTRVWVHIADPTRLLSPGDELDLEARRRSTTLYLPTGMVPMFPPELATGPMSLVQGKICCALSFGVFLDETGGVTSFSIHPSLIKPTYRLTYEDVDEMLQLKIQGEPEIATIARLAKLRKSWRQSQGAINISMPEGVIKVQGDEITINLVDDSPSRQLVAEMMILGGEVAARYGQTHNLPLPFRGQPQPELPPEEELLQLPPGPVRFCAMRRCMPKSEMGITPARHASLGLDTYTQVTSPIRRYTDLLAHFQIKAHLRGDPLPFSAEQLQEIMLSVTSAAQEATLVERQTNRYWILEYLRRNADQVWPALMLRWLREDDNLGLILLEELGLELAMSFKRSVEPGDRFEVQVSHADPRSDVIKFRELSNQHAQAAAT